MPLHEMHRKTPRLVDAQRAEGPLQSAQDLFSGSCLHDSIFGMGMARSVLETELL